MSGSPAAATSVVAQSSAEKMSLISVRGGHQVGPAHHCQHAIAALPVGAERAVTAARNLDLKSNIQVLENARARYATRGGKKNALREN